MYKVFFKILCIALLGASALSISFNVQAQRVVQYYQNQTITIPNSPERVATSWNAQNAILAMLGAGDKIVSTTDLVKTIPFFTEIVPAIKTASISSKGNNDTLNIETLIVSQPQIFFATGKLSDAQMTALKNAGISVALLKSGSMDALLERTLITGEILGSSSHQLANDYLAYFQRNEALVKSAVSEISTNKPMKVYHAFGSPLRTSGAPSLNHDWITLAGGINVAEHWFDNVPSRAGDVSLEQVIHANPDVIVTMYARDTEIIKNAPEWQSISAVREGRVYTNPKGLFWWCRETTEEALQFLWLATVLYPEQTKHINISKETQQFYKTFFNITLTDQQLKHILKPLKD
ncbi:MULTISPECIES: ABC transporter substrate-binding protein [Proteus]|uniref:ABC transporter substrate-binding protein n=1 Tax=Proteus TaxID=583 RepID=UPI001BA74B6F|nr:MULTISPECIES: ABC transporter substrate-binding protein [Proteus]MCM2366895.1 ABC transporter substrate-binding protein [Proteus sp. FZP2095]MCO4180469.1 ABC transporter substrate-binding protein [Proteus terrae]MCO4190271.1 ABC transporter substrate-binding protein [Proteus terrae]QUT00502.1 ABC transporter substrate-binding protein [Proteus terrae subsp. cibarius]UXA33136.1 ABC transporter substrate-binding protein [Proteus terrae]